MYVSGSKMVGCCTSLFGNTPQDRAVVPLMSRDRVFPLTSTCFFCIGKRFFLADSRTRIETFGTFLRPLMP